ncbi:MAG: BspA family leucine-rich repeat surface protein [Muribaculaceae bacterium]|nr:BspA family leucine-rich repeat surface protein [Muribaculaceae bacterium]
MSRQLKLAILLLLAAVMPAAAQSYIPITLAAVENGSVLYLPEQALPGAWVDFSVQPSGGYEIDTVTASKLTGSTAEAVECEKVNDQGQYGFYMPEDCVGVIVRVTFRKKEYTVSVSGGIAGGTVEVQGGSTYVFDDVVTLKATAADDYLLDGVTVSRASGGAAVVVTEVAAEGSVHYLQFVMPRDNVTVSATFKPVSRYAINIPECDHGSVTSDLATARVGDKVVLTVSNDPGAMFVDLSVVARYPLTTGDGGAHAPAAGRKAAPMWYVQQEMALTDNGDGTYEFTLPEAFDNRLSPTYQDDTEFLVTATFKFIGGRVIWCEGNKTLYFDYEKNPQREPQVGDPYEGQTITKLWTAGMAVPAYGVPYWNESATQKATRVVFQPAYADVRPTTCYYWFRNFELLETIEGIQHLNTSEVTDMRSMFDNCWSMKTINVNTFDVGNVSDATKMFFTCSSLTTIYCDNSWDIATADNMFTYDKYLAGAVSYRDTSVHDGTMANPVTGFFTASQPITLVVDGDGMAEVAERGFPGETVTVGVSPNRYSTSTAITVTGNVTGNEVECTAVAGGYTFTMPGEAVTVTVTITTPEQGDAVLWCAGNSTLYFVTQPIEVLDSGVWDGQEVTAMWNGNAVTAIGWSLPTWNHLKNDVTRAVIDESFAAARPRSCYSWFYTFNSLAAIEGLEHLNTSEVTNMNGMFLGCSLLTSLDVNTFDVGKVSNATGMFRACSSLTTIYCDNSWDIATAEAMFQGCSRLVGAVPYSSEATDGDMANPLTGYFATINDITVAGTPLATVSCDADRAYSGTVVTVTVTPASERVLPRSLTVTGNVTGNSIAVTATGSAGVYTFVMPGEAVTVAADLVQLDYTLAEALRQPDGTALSLIEPLHVAAVIGTHAYVTDGEGNWARLDLDSDISVRTGDNITHFDCVLANRDTAPAFSWHDGGSVGITHDDVATDIETIDLAEGFDMPVPCQVVEFTGYYYGGELRGLNSSVHKGQSLTLDSEYSGALTFAEGERLKIVCAVELKEPWQDSESAGAPRRARSSYDYDFQNLNGKVLTAESVATPTGIATLEADGTDGDTPWYTIDGRLLGGRPTAPGIYIHGNRKLLVK